MMTFEQCYIDANTPAIVENIIGAVSTCRIYSTEAEALAAWGKHSNKPVVMPDGNTTTPARYFGMERVEDVFVPWCDVKGERWPGEY